jgi:hypothetical protein
MLFIAKILSHRKFDQRHLFSSWSEQLRKLSKNPAQLFQDAGSLNSGGERGSGKRATDLILSPSIRLKRSSQREER